MTDINNLYKCSPRQVRTFVADCLEAGLVPFVQGSPGIGKSSIMQSLCDELDLELIDHRLSTSAPEDLSGLPRFDADGNAYFAPFADLFPIEGREIPKGKQGWMLFLDEFNQASKAVQSAAYKLVLDKQVGQKKLHERVLLTAAGNLSTDRAITNNLGTAMQSRVVHIEMEINFKHWLEDVAIKFNYDTRIIAFLNYKNGYLMDFRPDHNEKTFCCPRTWEFMNRLVKDKPITSDKTPLYGGTITSGKAVEFVTFANLFGSIPTLKEVLNDPDGCRIPPNQDSQWATVASLAEKVDEEVFEPLGQYIRRYDATFRILFFRFVLQRNEDLRFHSMYGTFMSDLSRYLNEA